MRRRKEEEEEEEGKKREEETRRRRRWCGVSRVILFQFYLLFTVLGLALVLLFIILRIVVFCFSILYLPLLLVYCNY